MFETLLTRAYLLIMLGFGFRPFLSGQWSKTGIKDHRLDLGFWLPVKFKFFLIIRWLRCDHDLFAKAEHQLQMEAIKQFQSRLGESSVSEAIPLPEVTADISPHDFFKSYVRQPHPVVIRGLAKNLPAVQKWNKAYFETTFGDTKVFADTITYDAEKSNITFEESAYTLKDAINTPGAYLNVSKAIFSQNPELEDDIADIQAWGKYLGNSELLMSQAFMGLQAEGAPFHCANAWNFFIMVNGEKEWTLVDPEYTFQMGAISHPTMISVESGVTGKCSTWRDEHSLYSKYCPRFKVTVRAGDVLLNPPWWWHEIKNLTPFSIGVSSRWLVKQYLCTNSLFDFLMCLSPAIWDLHRYTLQHKRGKVAKDSQEEDLLRKYVHRNLPGKERYFEQFLNRSKQKVFI